MEKIKRRSYSTDLSDKQWEEIAPYLSVDKDLWEKFLRHTVKVTREKAGRDYICADCKNSICK